MSSHLVVCPADHPVGRPQPLPVHSSILRLAATPEVQCVGLPVSVAFMAFVQHTDVSRLMAFVHWHEVSTRVVGSHRTRRCWRVLVMYCWEM